MEDNQKLVEQHEEESIDIVALLVKYLAYWPWFVASVVVCCICTYIYLRYQAPVYSVTSSVLIKEQDKRGGAAASPLAAIQDLGMLSMTSNFDNEVRILQSRTLIKKVVESLDLHVSMWEERTFGYDLPLYKETTPLQVYMTPEEADRLSGPVRVTMKYAPNQSLAADVVYVDSEGEEQQISETFSQLPGVLPTPAGVISFRANDVWASDSLATSSKYYHLKA